MNAARVAALLRELADEFDGVPDAEPSRPRAKSVRKPRTIVRPPGEATPIIAAQAERILRDKGFR